MAALGDSAKGGSVHRSASGFATTDSALFTDEFRVFRRIGAFNHDSAAGASEAAVAVEVCGEIGEGRIAAFL